MKEGGAGVLIIERKIVKINTDALSIVNGCPSLLLLYFLLKAKGSSLDGGDVLETHPDIVEPLLPAIFLFH